MTRTRTPLFNPHTFLNEVGSGKTMLPSPNKQMIFSQGDAADAVFYIQAGKVKLTVVSQQGKEAIVAILEEGAFFGESCLAGHTVRTATATSDDDSLVRQLHTQILTAYPDIEVVGQAATGDEAISYVQKLQPNIVILPGLRSMWSWSFPNMFSFPYIKKGLKA